MAELLPLKVYPFPWRLSVSTVTGVTRRFQDTEITIVNYLFFSQYTAENSTISISVYYYAVSAL